jgi:hypothetical protein
MPHKKTEKARAAERDYSERSLLDKLAIRPGQRVAVLGIEDGAFLGDLAARVSDLSREVHNRGADMIFFGVEDVKKLARLKTLARAIQKNGAIWVVYPKGRKDIRELDVINSGKAAGLTDNKVCGFSSTHTALRFVIPLANR